MTSSSLYVGKVRHTRLQPFHHDFEYRIYYGMFDLDELEELDRSLRLFSIQRFNLFGFDPSDHGRGDVASLRQWVDTTLARASVDLEGGAVRLLAIPRVMGYVFNPLSVWYCFGPDEEVRAVIHEVRNTFGDRHAYVVPVVGRPDLRHDFEKELHVSPFNGMDQRYAFTLTFPGEHLSLAIEQSDVGGKMFRAGLRLSRRPMTDRQLLALFITHPLMTLRVIAGIHWQALRLWAKGAKFHRRPAPPREEVTVISPIGATR